MKPLLGTVRTACLPFAVVALMIGAVAYGDATSAGVAETTQRDIALGIWAPQTPWNLANLDAIESATDKKNAIVNFFWSWDDANGPPDTSLFGRIADRGSVPMVTWMPQDYRFGTNQPNYRLSEILTGRYDTFIAQWALALGDYGRPVMMRFAHEMNGNWYPWGVDVNGNTPSQFISVWRHVHGIFQANGASNVIWVWAPNVENADAALFFPGDAYIDWIGLSVYNDAQWGIWRSFSDLTTGTYNRVTSISGRPVMIAEIGTSEGDAKVGGNKADWIRDVYEVQVPHNFPRIMAVVWFNEDKTGVQDNAGNYSLYSSSEALEAYKQAIKPYSSTRRLDGSEPSPTATPIVDTPTITPTPSPTATPTASFTFSCTALECNFDGSASSDSDGIIETYEWNFGDGSNAAAGATVQHTYDADGKYTVTLTVTDNEGATGSDSQVVTVSSGGSGASTLTTTGYKARGLHKADLKWSGATSGEVHIYRDENWIATTANDGAYTDDINNRGAGSYTHQVCEAGEAEAAICSNVTEIRIH